MKGFSCFPFEEVSRLYWKAPLTNLHQRRAGERGVGQLGGGHVSTGTVLSQIHQLELLGKVLKHLRRHPASRGGERERERERERRDGEGIRGESRDEICVMGKERKRRGEPAMSWSGNKQMQLLLQSKNSLTVTESRGRNLWASVSRTA